MMYRYVHTCHQGQKTQRWPMCTLLPLALTVLIPAGVYKGVHKYKFKHTYRCVHAYKYTHTYIHT